MTKKTLKLSGKNIYLRPVRKSDVGEVYLGWLNDPEVNRYLESRFVRHTLKSLEEFVVQMSRLKGNIFFAICLNDDDRHIGNIKIGPVDVHHQFAHVGIVIGAKELWGRGLATEAIVLATDYAFKELGLHKLLAGCYATNMGSARAFMKAGYKREGTYDSHWLCEGKYVDGWVFTKINSRKSKA